MRKIVVAGTGSGVGKTTVACGLMAAYRRRGHRVQPFKVGPDYIDPTHHGQAAERPSRNLDSVLLSAPALQALSSRAANSADISIIEGMMGLFDGRSNQGDQGSTAQVAKLIEAPVVVVLDVAKTARTAAAIALGCVRFDPELQIVGFILNQVASEAHRRSATEAIETATGLPVLGVLPRNPELSVPERHLGLHLASEDHQAKERIARLRQEEEESFDLDRLWALADADPLPNADWDGMPIQPRPKVARIALAQDAAFGFYYPDSLDLLEAWGAELVPFSPIADDGLSEAVQGVYLGGGYPELFAAELAANRSMHASLRLAARAGLPIYGECGGLMYLGASLADLDGKHWPMAGVVPLASAMAGERAVVGYRTVTALRPSPLLPEGARTVGHEFHYSRLVRPVDPSNAAYRVTEPSEGLEGYAHTNVLASYVHLHFGSDAAMAQRFVSACAGPSS